MRSIAVLNQKGGVGKTTTATNLGRAFQLAGHSTLLIDSDPQGSARDFASAREENPLVTIGMDRAGILERDIKSITSHQIIIIDGAPQVRELAVAAIKSANLVIIPVQPSPYDIWATNDLVELVKSRIELTEGTASPLKAAFLISRAIEGTNISKEVLEPLHEYGLPILKTRFTQRVVFATSAMQGMSVMDAEPKGKAAEEVMRLQAEIAELLGIGPTQ